MNKGKTARNVAFLLVSLFLLTFSFSMVSAFAPVLISPNSTTTSYTGSVVWNATNGTGSTGVLNMRECDIWALSSSTANSTYVRVNVTNTTNLSVGQTNISSTFNSALLEDASDYSFYASCFNETAQYNSTALTSIILDNTVPTTPTSLVPASDSTNDNGTVVFSGTLNDASTTSCRLFFVNGSNYGGPSQSMTYSTTSCTLTLSNVPDSSYEFLVQASDGRNTTNSSTSRFIVAIPTSRSNLFTQQGVEVTPSGEITQKPFYLKTWFIIIIVVLLLIWIIRKR